MQDVAKEIERVMLADIKAEVGGTKLGVVPPVLPESARGQIDMASMQLKQMQDDAKVLMSALEHISQACAKMLLQLDHARAAIHKAQQKL